MKMSEKRARKIAIASMHKERKQYAVDASIYDLLCQGHSKPPDEIEGVMWRAGKSAHKKWFELAAAIEYMEQK